MEIADVFVINKADRAGVDETRRDLAADARAVGRDAAPAIAGWPVPIVADRRARPATASPSCGTPSRPTATTPSTSGELERRRRFRLGEELREIVARRLEQRARELCTGERWDALTDDVLAGDIDPWSAADEMLAPVL